MAEYKSLEEINEYIDIAGALDRVRGNKTLYRRMLNLFLQSAEFAAFEESLAANDNNRCCEVIHGIKGMTGNLSLNKLFELSADLNTKFKNDVRDDTTVEEYRLVLTQTLACVESAIKLMDEGKL